MTTQPNWGVRLLTSVVKLWQFSAPLRVPRCRFAPSCSHYAVEALRAHGAMRGSSLAVRRLLRCHPWNPGGIDYVPPARHAAGATDKEVSDGTGSRG